MVARSPPSSWQHCRGCTVSSVHARALLWHGFHNLGTLRPPDWHRLRGVISRASPLHLPGAGVPERVDASHPGETRESRRQFCKSGGGTGAARAGHVGGSAQSCRIALGDADPPVSLSVRVPHEAPSLPILSTPFVPTLPPGSSVLRPISSTRPATFVMRFRETEEGISPFAAFGAISRTTS